MDVLRNQIIERKVLELVQSQAKFKDEPYAPEKATRRQFQWRRAVGGGGEMPVITENRKKPKRSDDCSCSHALCENTMTSRSAAIHSAIVAIDLVTK